MFSIAELKKRPEGIDFDQILSVRDELIARNPDILDVKDVRAKGNISYDDGLFLLNYELTYLLELPSSRSLQPVVLKQKQMVAEVFAEQSELTSKKELADQDLLLLVDGPNIDLAESVIDNILLSVPLQVLTDDEQTAADLPAGESWAVLTEEQYQSLKAEKREASSPFAALDGLFDE
ncbi:DUF177 domain-containing protein [Streptococcus sp. H49]|uniref:YceD family protein n=1 Tax=Streptococcus huangxiaojuni TaxID=3237239 RepID=UPI0034A3E9FD